MLYDEVLKNIYDYNLIEKGDTVLIGVSGGIDSISLLNVLLDIKKCICFKILVIHVNHQLRGEESDMDEIFVKNFCKRHELECIVKRENVQKISKALKMTIEEAARKLRYDVFFKEAQRFLKFKIALAHNSSDQVETILMNILRGTGMEGLTGMDFKREQVIRPFLDISRREIEQYVKINNLDFRFDSSNNSLVHTRNCVRLELIPFIKEKLGLDISQSILRLSSIIYDENEFLKEYCCNVYSTIVSFEQEGEIKIKTKEFLNLHLAIKKRLVRHIVERLKGNLKDIESVNINQVLDFIEQGKTNKRINLPRNIVVFKGYEEVVFLDKSNKLLVDEDADDFEIRLDFLGGRDLKNYGKIDLKLIDLKDLDDKDKVKNSKAMVQYFDYSKIKSKKLVFRNRRNGDRIKLFENGRKKIKDYFIDKKIDKNLRDKLPLIAIDSDILWVIGHAVTLDYGIDEKTTEVLMIEWL